MANELGADLSMSDSSIEMLLRGSSTESFQGFDDVMPIDGGSIFDVVLINHEFYCMIIKTNP